MPVTAEYTRSAPESRAADSSTTLFSADAPFISDTANITKLTKKPVTARRLNILALKLSSREKSLYFILLSISSPRITAIITYANVLRNGLNAEVSLRDIVFAPCISYNENGL